MPRGEAAGQTWIAIGTNLFGHEKIVSHPDATAAEQLAAFMALIAWSRVRLTDGVVADRSAETELMRVLEIPRQRANNVLGILRESGLLKRRKGAYVIPDYGDWQQTRESATALSERNAERARRRWAGRHRDTEGDAAPHAAPHASGMQRREEKISPISQNGGGEERATGETPRQRGTNPRAAGTSPRQRGTNPRRVQSDAMQLVNARTLVDRLGIDAYSETDWHHELETRFPAVTAEQRANLLAAMHEGAETP